MTRYVKTADLRVLDTLQGLAAHHNRTWCYPSLAKIRELLLRHTGRQMSVRTLIRHLNQLVRQGYVKRIRRHKRARNGSLELHSTCYVIIGRAVHRAGKLLRACLSFLEALRTTHLPSAVTKAAHNGTPSLGSIMIPARL